MTPLMRALIEKAGHDHGFEHTGSATGAAVTLGSASHAKPWADCTTDAERLDVFNGFWLSANLDALFDKFLISFSDQGHLLIGHSVSMADRLSLFLSDGLRLRWVATGHARYLPYHRDRFQTVNAMLI